MISANELAQLEKACSNENLKMYAVLDELDKILISKVIFSHESNEYTLYIPKKLYHTFKNPSSFVIDLTGYLSDLGYDVYISKKYSKLTIFAKANGMYILKSIRYWFGEDILKTEDKFVKITISW